MNIFFRKYNKIKTTSIKVKQIILIGAELKKMGSVLKEILLQMKKSDQERRS